MNALQMFILTLLLISLAVLIYFCKKPLKIILNRGCSPKKIFKQFREKMWMTFGLGLAFTCMYLLSIYLSGWFVNKETFLNILSFGIKKPRYLVYLGLFIFSFNTLLIYLFRIIIKYFYLKKNL